MSDVIYNISSGFFDSVNGDRLYSAADMNKPYKRVIADGIFPTPQGTPSTDFQVVAVSGMSVAVLAGSAMIGARWAENTDDVGITIAGNSSSSPRIDSIFLHIDTGMDTRAAGVVYRQGSAAGTPTAPAMVQTDNITELRLADILVAPSAAIITQANITDQRGGSDCPWVAGLIQQVDTSALFEQYRAAYAEQQQDQADEWNTFMDHLARDYDISMSLRKHESTYTSTAAASLIPINIDGYDTTKDLLQVYINGIFAVEGTHYIVKNAAQIQLTNAISAGQKVHFVIYKAVMGGAQPIIPTDEQVQDAVDTYMEAHPGALVVDPELSDTSTHAIQNKAVTEAFASVNGRLTEQITSVTSRIQACENELGTHPEVEYVLPEGYTLANTETGGGTRKYKYVDNRLLLYIRNTHIGETGGVEVPNTGLAVDTLGYTIEESDNPKLKLDVTNTFPSSANPLIVLRFYSADYSANRGCYIYLDGVDGDLIVDLRELAESNSINLVTYPNAVIRSIYTNPYTSTDADDTVSVDVIGFFVPVTSTALSDRVSANETNIAKNSEDIDTISGNVDSLSESVSGYDGRITSNAQSIEDVKSNLGLDYTYTIPDGYKSANYENLAGTKKAKYENNKFVFYYKNTTIGTVATTELATSAFGPTVSQELVFDVTSVDRPMLSFAYENTYTSEMVPQLVLRAYNTGLTSFKTVYVDIPVGNGHITVDVLKALGDANVSISNYPMLLIRAIGMYEHTATGEEVLCTEIDGYYDGGNSIVDSVNSLKTEMNDVQNRLVVRTSSIYNNPFRFRPYWAHMFLNTLNDTDIYVPSQSLYDIQISKRMGFDIIEVNTQVLSDGVSICLHGDNHKFGAEFVSADGVTDVANTLISSVDYEWVKANVRYKHKFPKMNIYPPTLEEFLFECKKFSMIPVLNFRNVGQIELANKIMGIDNYLLYGDGIPARRNSDAMVVTWANLTTKQQIVEWVEDVGAPCMVGCMHPENFTAEEWVDIVETVHQMGGLLAFVQYQTSTDTLKFIEYGFDVGVAMYGLNPSGPGNLQNFSSALNFNDYTVVDGIETPGQLTMQNGGTVTLANTIGSAKFLTGMWLDVTFIGSISVSMGRFISHANCQSTSTKSKTIRLSTYFMNAIPNFEVKALSAGTIIENIDCKVSEF